MNRLWLTNKSVKTSNCKHSFKECPNNIISQNATILSSRFCARFVVINGLHCMPWIMASAVYVFFFWRGIQIQLDVWQCHYLISGPKFLYGVTIPSSTFWFFLFDKGFLVLSTWILGNFLQHYFVNFNVIYILYIEVWVGKIEWFQLLLPNRAKPQLLLVVFILVLVIVLVLYFALLFYFDFSEKCLFILVWIHTSCNTLLIL